MLTLILGGSGSGKSAYAEKSVLSLSGRPRLYVATMAAGDEESLRRIEKHRRMRAGKGFETLECPTHLEEADIPEGSVVLLECLSNLAANEMFAQDGRGASSEEAILEGIAHVLDRAEDLVLVTNNIFEDAEAYDEMTEAYRRILANLNRRLAEKADRVVEVTFGLPFILKEREERE